MTRRGVVVSINSDSAAEATHLNQEAAKSMKFGALTHDEALKLVTLNPAMQLGIDKRVGTIDVGKDADLVIYNHDPLSAYAVAQKTIVDGRVLFDREKDIADRAGLEKEKKDLIAKAKKAAEKEKKSDEKKPDDKKPDAAKKPEDKPKPPSDAVHRDSGEEVISTPTAVPCEIPNRAQEIPLPPLLPLPSLLPGAGSRAAPTICLRHHPRQNHHPRWRHYR